MGGCGRMKYYAVWAWNGVAVFNNWEKADYCMDLYLIKPRCKAFSTFWEAESHAIFEYNCLRDNPLEDYHGSLKVNTIVFRKNMK